MARLILAYIPPLVSAFVRRLALDRRPERFSRTRGVDDALVRALVRFHWRVLLKPLAAMAFAISYAALSMLACVVYT